MWSIYVIHIFFKRCHSISECLSLHIPMPVHLHLGDRQWYATCLSFALVCNMSFSTHVQPPAQQPLPPAPLPSYPPMFTDMDREMQVLTHIGADTHGWDRPECLPQNPSHSESAAPHHPCLPSQRSPLLQSPSPRVIIFHSHTLSKPLALSHLLDPSIRHRQHKTRQCRRKSQFVQPGGRGVGGEWGRCRRGGRDTENECGDTKGCVSEAIRRCFVLGSRRSCHSSRVGGGR